jgi:hypothetical protein
MISLRYDSGKHTNKLRSGTPSPDFPGGVGESQHVGRALQQDISAMSGVDGLRAMGLERFDQTMGRTPGEKQVMASANRILGFD